MNKELIGFLQAINYSDYSMNFNLERLGKSFKDISDEFNKVLQKFKQSRNEKEESLLYLQTAVRHVGVGVISFDSKGKIDLANKAAKKILKLNRIDNIFLLNNLSKDFGELVFNLSPGKKITHKIIHEDESIQLLFYATEFKMRNQIYKLVTLQNIQPELEEKEIEAYQKLIRVLTHEIMNSVTPISSLASTVNQWLTADNHDEKISKETMNDISAAVNTIKKRSEGLVGFVEKYRSLTRIPKPSFQVFKAVHLFERIQILMEAGLKNSEIKFHFEVVPDYLELTADPDLLEQVLINLLNNAVQSFGSTLSGKIFLKAMIDDRGRASIKIIDNGPGIAEDIIDKIFIPFFSTKKEGSGIGLSLSQQIIRTLGGTISVTSEPNVETVFTIRL